MELIDRYVYAVVRKIPKVKRGEVEREVRISIDHLMERYPARESEASKAEKALLEMGDPGIVAERYTHTQKYLIGPKNYRAYMFMLKLVLVAVFIGISIVNVVQVASAADANLTKAAAEYFGLLWSGLAQAFTWVTVMFAIMEYKGADFPSSLKKPKRWSLDDLPAAMDKKAVIGLGEPIAGILFSTIFLTILYIAPQRFAAYIPQESGELAVIPIFDAASLKGYNIFLLSIFIIAIAKEILKLVYRKWTIALAVSLSILSVISMVLFIIVFFNPAVWNDNFGVELAKYVNFDFDFPAAWKQITNAVLFCIVIVTVLEMGSALYKGVKYNGGK
ncbi:MAG: hypothetical protein ACE3JP_06270 [Ectobacillus sp.]